MQKTPDLMFFCELDSINLTKLFEDRFVMDDLKSLNAGVSLGILDLSAERAEVVQKLNKMGIPVIAWLLHPKESGYWFNLDNHAQAVQRYQSFLQWSEHKKLEWAGIGLDMEPEINQLQSLLKREKGVLKQALNRLANTKAYEQAKQAYLQLVQQIKQDGYFVEAYHLPIIVDDRKARSSVIQRLTGIIELPVDREVLMLYSSFFRPSGQALLWQYAAEADAIGIGVTGGGVEMEGIEEKPPLSWDEFSDDLHLAWRTGKPIYVFSLEACVAQGFLEKLITFDWNEITPIPKAAGLNMARKILHGVLWFAQRPWVGIAGIVGTLVGALLLRRRSEKTKQ